MTYRLALAGLLVASSALAIIAQAPAPVLRFTSPEEGAYVSDRVQLAVRFEPADAALVVKSVTFFADGRQVCVAADPSKPRCEWDAGPQVKEHAFRAVAILGNGERRVATVNTQGLSVAESVSVEVVQVTATVTDGDGRFVKGLKKEQFRVFENGVLQPLVFFGAEETPLEVIVALDVSASMVDVLPDLKTGVREFLQALRPTDTVTVLAFNDSVFEIARRDVEATRRLATIDRIRAFGSTALYDGVRDALARLSRGRGRRALVVFTDGEDSASSSTLQQTQNAIGESDVTIFVIGLGRGKNKNELRKVMDALAVPSGGRVLAIEKSEKLPEQFREVVQELAHQYILGYEPPTLAKPGEWRTLKVELVKVNHRIRTRAGYRGATR